MDLSNGDQVGATSDDDLLEAHAHVWNHVFNFINSMSLKCAVQLGIPDVIHNHGQPISLSNLVAALNLHPSKAHFVQRLMRMLVHSDFFAEQQDVYALTPASRLLLKGGPLSTTPFLLMILDPIVTAPWHLMSTWLQNGTDIPASTAFEMEHGRPFWELTANEPRFGNLFNEAMEADSHLLAKAMIKECRGVFEGLDSLVDVGGGTGIMAKAIANAFPNINCTVLDLPHVVADMQGTNNLDFVGGDMFHEIPPANAIFLKWILHDWSDEESVKILKRCREAIVSKNGGSDGKVIIVDIVVCVDNKKKKIDKKSSETQLMWDMLMMVCLTGKERTEADWEKLFLAAGFTHYNITHTLGLRSLIELYPQMKTLNT